MSITIPSAPLQFQFSGNASVNIPSETILLEATQLRKWKTIHDSLTCEKRIINKMNFAH